MNTIQLVLKLKVTLKTLNTFEGKSVKIRPHLPNTLKYYNTEKY